MLKRNCVLLLSGLTLAALFHSSKNKAKVSTKRCTQNDDDDHLQVLLLPQWSMTSVSPGLIARKHFFNIDPDIAFLNGSAFGSIPKMIVAVRERISQQVERNPYQWHRDVMPKLMSYVSSCVCNYLGIDHGQLLLAPNTSAGIYSILRSLNPLRSGDVLLITSLTYHSIRDAAKHMCSLVPGCECVTVDIPFPVHNEEEIVEAFQNTLKALRGSRRVRLAVVEHISSKPAIALPLVRILTLFKQAAVPVLVDGAHAVGQVQFKGEAPEKSGEEQRICLSNLPCAAYVGNFYKHFSCPRAVAFLYVNPAHFVESAPFDPAHLMPTDVAVEYDTSKVNHTKHARPAYLVDSLVRGIYDESTRDFTQYLVIPAALAFRRNILNSVELDSQRYCRDLVEWTVTYLCSQWHTSRLVCEQCTPNMLTAQLPSNIVSVAERRLRTASNRHQGIHNLIVDWLWMQHGVSVAMFMWEGRLLCRITVEIYTHRAEIERLAAAVTSLSNSLE